MSRPPARSPSFDSPAPASYEVDYEDLVADEYERFLDRPIRPRIDALRKRFHREMPDPGRVRHGQQSPPDLAGARPPRFFHDLCT